MSETDNEIIYHNYPQSPVAEKVRVAFGIKSIAWRNVEIPRLPPKPLLTTLTGGYRRTPVMQIGADIYCDSQCIMRELERRYPEPSFLPGNDSGLLWCLSRWADGALFDLSVKIVLGAAGDDLPEDFARDRGRLYLGENWAEGLKAANAQLPHLVSQLRGPLHWIDNLLSDGRPYLMGEKATTFDAQFYHVIWFVMGRWDGGTVLVEEFPNVFQWVTTIKNLGHGTPSSMSGEEAILRAAPLQPKAERGVAEHEPQGLTEGQSVAVTPDVDGGEQAVLGKVRFADAQTITIDRQSEDAGEVSVSFPRIGYRVEV